MHNTDFYMLTYHCNFMLSFMTVWIALFEFDPNEDRGSSLGLLRLGGSNEYPQRYAFDPKLENVSVVNPTFPYINRGFAWCLLHELVNAMWNERAAGDSSILTDAYQKVERDWCVQSWCTQSVSGSLMRISPEWAEICTNMTTLQGFLCFFFFF